MSFTEKNNNRKTHKGGDKQHIQARRMRRAINGAFGNPKILGLQSWGWNDLILGTTGIERPNE